MFAAPRVRPSERQQTTGRLNHFLIPDLAWVPIDRRDGRLIGIEQRLLDLEGEVVEVGEGEERIEEIV
jgi:hypothetical protein